MDSKIRREIDFHNKIYEDDSRQVVSKYYSVNRSSEDFYRNFLLNHSNGKRVLEYGCGEGSYGFLLAENGAHVTGIDISDYAIQQAQKSALEQNLEIDFQVMDAENLDTENDSFDIVCGTGILHHLELDKAFKEIARVLKPDGQAIFIEPLGHNVFINMFRKFTPNLRSEDEHPLMVSDLQAMDKYFANVEQKYFHLFSLATVPFRNLKIFPALLRMFEKIDEICFKLLPFLRKNAWMVVITFSSPKKSRA